MSMDYATEYGYGMFLKHEEAIAMAKKYFEAKGKSIDSENIDLDDLVYEMDASYITEYNYEYASVEYLHSSSWGFESCTKEGVMIYAIRASGTIFANEVETKCYKDIHEMADEFRKFYGQYLPDDFDYESHMAFFKGSRFV